MTTRAPLSRSATALFDGLVASCFLVLAEVELVFDRHRTDLLALEAIAIVVLAAALWWRRRVPLAATFLATTAALVLTVHGDIQTLNLPMILLFVPPYSVARYAAWKRAVVGLLVVSVVPVVLALTSPTSTGLVFSIGAIATSWTVGRALRASESKADALRRRKAGAETEREERQRLAVTAERARVAVELQAVVVDSVSDMVLQAEAADRLLTRSPARADSCLASVESTAHQVLDDMRRVLGILRDPDRAFELAPLPGVADIASLRGDDGRELVLTVHGSVPVLPASIDLALYRVVQSALDSATDRPFDEALEVIVDFTHAGVEMEISVAGSVCVAWPTVSMREWMALCQGRIGTARAEPAGERLTIAIPQLSGASA